MHYLITGGCGFIGSHLVRRLLEKGHGVTIIDDLSNSRRESVPAGVRVIVADMTAPGILDDLVSEADGVFHLAAIVSVVRSTLEWLPTHRVTLGGTVSLLDALVRKARRIPVVFASSAAVYGNCADIPLSENSCCMPISAYGADKLACEHHARIGTELHGIPTVGLRFFNVYGAGQDPASPYAGVISIFAGRMRQGLPITVFGDGEQTRDYIYVGDVVDGMLLSMRKLEEKAIRHGVFNVATGVQTSVNALARSLSATLGADAPIMHAPARPGEIRVSAGDTSLSAKALGFRAATTLAGGLEQAVRLL